MLMQFYLETSGRPKEADMPVNVWGEYVDLEGDQSAV